MIPLVALTAVQFGVLLGGSIVTESVFALQGLGHLAWESITRRDIPTVQAVVIILAARSEEHTSELQSLMRISYAVFCLKKKKQRAVFKQQQDASTVILMLETHETDTDA